jgi:hypothetical protein
MFGVGGRSADSSSNGKQGSPGMIPQIGQFLEPTRTSTMTCGAMSIRIGGRLSIAANLLFKYLSDTTDPNKQRKDKTSLSEFLSFKPYGHLMAHVSLKCSAVRNVVWSECNDYHH